MNTSVSPTVVQEGNSVHLKCLTTSTTVPPSHHLTMLVSWSINGQLVETTGRYRAENNILTIYSMTRADDSLLVECEAREDEGLTTRANMSMIINCEIIICLSVAAWHFFKTTNIILIDLKEDKAYDNSIQN